MSNNPKQDEMRIGRLLADGLQELAAETPCLTEDQLDNLVAGTVSTEEQERYFSHIAGCDMCNHAFVVTKRLAMAETTVVPKHIRPAWNYYAPLALAATVLLVISAQRIFTSKSDVTAPPMASNNSPAGYEKIAKAPEQSAPPSPAVVAAHKPKMTRQDNLLAMAGTLGKSAHGKELDIPFAATSQAGFAGGSAAEANRFHTGFALFSLAVACESQDRNLTRRASASLVERLQRLELPAAVQNKSTQLAALLDESSDPKTFRELAATVTTAMTARYPEDPYGELGVWTAALRVAVQTRNTTFITNADFTGIGAGLDKPGTPQGVTRMISEIHTIAKGQLNDEAWEKIDSLADDIQKKF